MASVTIIGAVRKLLAEQCNRDDPDSEGKRRRWAEVCAESLLINFCAGNPSAIKQVLDRIDGLVLPPKEDIDMKSQALQNLVVAMQGYARTVVEEPSLPQPIDEDDPDYMELD